MERYLNPSELDIFLDGRKPKSATPLIELSVFVTANKKRPSRFCFCEGLLVSYQESTQNKALNQVIIFEDSTMKIEFLTAHGAFDSHKESSPNRETAGKPYDVITLDEIIELAIKPSSREKRFSQFFIPSVYRGCDGRSHSIQRIRGSFMMLTADIDEGNLSYEKLNAAIDEVVGDCSPIIYMTASSKPDNRKWRVLVPLTDPIAGFDFTDTQNAFYDLLAEQGVVCDRALSRPGQLVYLPNVPPKRRDSNGVPNYYQYSVVLGMKAELTAQHNIIVRRERVRAELRAKKLTIDMRREKLKEDRLLRVEKFGEQDSPIDAFNAANSISILLERYGYERQGTTNHWRSPHQSSSSFATIDCVDHWVSQSASDTSLGLGHEKDGYCWGTAFDLLVHFRYGGDFKAALRTCAREMRLKKMSNDLSSILKGEE